MEDNSESCEWILVTFFSDAWPKMEVGDFVTVWIVDSLPWGRRYILTLCRVS